MASLHLLLLLASASASSPLHSAAESGDVAALLSALEMGYDDLSSVDADHYTALHLAAGMGHLDIVKLLLERGAPAVAVDDNGEQPLHLASHLGRTEIAQLLLDSGADPSAASNSGYTPLHMAAEQGGSLS